MWSNAQAAGWRSLAGTLLCLLLVNTWWSTAGRWNFASEVNDLALLNAQVEAFAHGQLSLLEQPDPKLLQLQNPYSPEQNRGTRLLDAVLYGKKYYTYFGPAPLILIMLPWRLIFHHPISPALLAWILATGAGLSQALAVREAARRWFPQTSPFLRVSLEIGYSVCGLLLGLAISHETFDVPILAGACFSGLLIFFCTRIFARGSEVGNKTLACAALSAGLAAASRASLIPFATVLLLGAIAYAGKTSTKPLSLWRALLPFALCLLGLAAYNQARFGSPFDFGNKYTLVEVDWTKTAAFSASYAPLNAYFYLLSAPKLALHFPFFVASAPPPFAPPPGYLISYVDRVAGCVAFYPFFLFVFPAAALLAFRKTDAALKALLGALFGSAVFLGAVLCAFVGASMRYQAEFLLPLYLPAAIGALSFGAVAKRGLRVAGLGVIGLVLLWTVLGNFAIATVGYRGLEAKNHHAAATLAAAVDHATFPVEKLFGLAPKIPELSIRFPSDKTGKLEPIWVGGRPGDADFLYAYYVSDKLIQFGFESMGRGGPLSAAIPIDYQATHRMKLYLGSFAPPASHPLFHGVRMDEADTPQRMLGIELDGKFVLVASVQFHDAKGVYFWGSSPDEAAFGRQFTGDLRLSWTSFSRTEFLAWQEERRRKAP